MPGRDTREAVDAFIAPIKAAVSCLGQHNVELAPPGWRKPTIGTDYSWSLGNEGAGIELRNQATNRPRLRFVASMNWTPIADPDNGPYRISTLAYRYTLTLAKDEQEVWAIHWHPSPDGYIEPHVHLGGALLLKGSPLGTKHHLRTRRMTFESAVRWALECGAKPARSNWDKVLAKSEAKHHEHASWT